MMWIKECTGPVEFSIRCCIEVLNQYIVPLKVTEHCMLTKWIKIKTLKKETTFSPPQKKEKKKENFLNV